MTPELELSRAEQSGTPVRQMPGMSCLRHSPAFDFLDSLLGPESYQAGMYIENSC